MADDDAGRVDPLLLEDLQLLEPDRGHHRVGRDRETGPASGPPGGAMDALLGRRDPGLVGADLPDDAWLDPGVPHSVGRLADQLIRQRVHRPALDEGLGRVEGAPVPAATHDDVQPGRSADRGEPGGVAPDAGQREVDQAVAAGLAEQRATPRG